MIEHKYDNLTKKEELELGGKVQEMNKLKEKMKTGYDTLTEEEETVMSVGQEAFETLISNHYNQARKIAHKNHKATGTRYEREDLIQDAILALVEATTTYDPVRDCRLSTHAHYGITKKVTSTINFQRLVRMPENKMGEYIQISAAQKEYGKLSEDGKAEYANELDYIYANVALDREEIDLILQNMQPQVSLNAPIYDGEGELMDILVDEDAAYEVVEYGNLDNKVTDIIDLLNNYEKDLIAFEYGAFEASMTYNEFKEKYKLSDKKVKLEVNKVNRKMRKLAEKA